MRSTIKILLVSATCLLATGTVSAVELLISGDFETPQGVGDIPGWELDEFFTGSSEDVNSASVTDPPAVPPDPADRRLLFRPFVSIPVGVEEGNYDADTPNDVDGNDFLNWQRGNTPNSGNPADLTTWQENYGRRTLLSNAVLSQTLPAIVGKTYTFSGTSTFEDNYSGQVVTLDEDGPFGAIPSPTSNTFKIEFLNSAGAVIGSPATRDVVHEQLTLGFPGTPLNHTPLVSQAPTGTVEVRVTAEARDMAWNGAASAGFNQAAFYNNFSFTASDDATTELLTNPSLDDNPPDALDFWNIVTDPDPCCGGELLRTPIAGFSNNTPGGSRGVWLSAFFGGDATREAGPVDGIISQTVRATPGATYTFSGSTKFEGNYSGGLDTIEDLGDTDILFSGLASPTKTEIELAFLDSSGEVISSSVIDVEAARVQLSPTNNANDNRWYEHTFQAVAPAGTVSARLSGQMIDGVNAGFGQQSAFFDDFSLNGPAALSAVSSVPEPTSIVSLAFGTFLLTFRRNRQQS